MLEDIGIDSRDLVTLLLAGSKEYRCGMYLYNLSPIERQQIYQELETERLKRKYLDLTELYNIVQRDWNQLLLLFFMRSLSDEDNRQNYMEIALRVNLNMILHERGSLRSVEALLIAASGLVDTLPRDRFTDDVRKDAAYMLHKYQITPLNPRQWSRRKITTAKEPILRLAQVAKLLYDNEFVFNKLISCRTRQDIIDLFNIEARLEWNKYFGDAKVRRIGVEKCDLIGINLVVPMLYAYGHFTSNEELTDAANDLNESLPAESNRYITGWKREGLTPTSAYETQALIQLKSVYCGAGACERCIVYKHMCSRASILKRIPAFLNHQK